MPSSCSGSAAPTNSRWRASATIVADLCKGWRVDQVSQIVNETLHELINPYVYAEAAALIEEHRAAGRDVVVVSTSGEEMVRPIAEQLGITDVIATRMVVEDGRYTGEVAYYAAGPTKAEAVRELAASATTTWRRRYAYSDSISDVPLLETVGHADRGQPRPRPAPGGRRARLAGARVPPPGPAVAPAARPPGRAGGRRRARARRRRRDRSGPLRPAPPAAPPSRRRNYRPPDWPRSPRGVRPIQIRPHG